MPKRHFKIQGEPLLYSCYDDVVFIYIQFIMEDYKFLFKVVLVGNAGVGKTCLVRRFTQGLFPPGQGATIGVDFMIKTVEIDGEKVKLQIWDTAGQERFRSITQSYYRSAHALILVYDISCQPTFDCLPDWLREIEEYASNKVLRILVGNKMDREDREIPMHVGEDFAQRHDMYFLETSAKEAENVEKLFMEIAAELMEQARSKELPRYDTNSPTINGRTTSIGDSNCCSKLS
ncbi:ras-related protein Rab-30 isoform X1 [Frankliniella occidentalis]|uniref:Ras-related protein Rab-30 n=2 Tax=Frankliniella occidentalis TaxID=133901 RepID=A0A9C6XTJ9_FRAOC|nr:ras-related protein Rab-30 isoform X1 [Frankliniella occidentalis]